MDDCMPSDAFEAREASRRKLVEATAALDSCTDEIGFHQIENRRSACEFNERIDRRRQQCSQALDDCRRNYETQVLQTMRQAQYDIGKLSTEIKQLHAASDAAVAVLVWMQTERQRLVAAATAEFEAADNRTTALRILAVWKFRAFIRLYPSRPDSADRLLDWIDKNVRPYLTKIYVENDKQFWYEVSFGSGRVAVYLPSKLEPYGRLEVHYCFPADFAAPFRIRSPPWFSEPATPDCLDFGRFVLATYLTVPGKDLATIRSDYFQTNPRSAIDRIEQFLLRKSTVYRRKRNRIGLIEYWLPGLPTVLLRIILLY